jgi:4-amino-4-deoxy-L-arabinose transferase-like glycosyltransferase
MLAVPPLDLFTQQILVWNPLVLPLWLVGGVALLRRTGDDPGRIFAAIFVTTAAILIANGTSRPNYLALAMPPLIAAGAIELERAASRRGLRWPLPLVAVLIAGLGLAGAPLTLPILPVSELISFKAAVGLGAPQMEDREVGALDPHFADMIGWEEIVDPVAEVYSALPSEDRERAGILASNYSEAGAIDLLGPERGLPAAISPHNNYWLWGTGEADGSVMLLGGGRVELWREHWGSIEEAATWDCGHCLPGRNHGMVYIARSPRTPLSQIWQALRRYN